MPEHRHRIVVILAGLAVVVCGCGSSGKDEAAQSRAQDAAAKSSAQSVSVALEACFIDKQSYVPCKDVPGTKLTVGAGAGQTEITKATADGYTVAAHSASGTTFRITKAASGATAKTCDKAGKGGCPAGGTW